MKIKEDFDFWKHGGEDEEILGVICYWWWYGHYGWEIKLGREGDAVIIHSSEKEGNKEYFYNQEGRVDCVNYLKSPKKVFVYYDKEGRKKFIDVREKGKSIEEGELEYDESNRVIEEKWFEVDERRKRKEIFKRKVIRYTKGFRYEEEINRRRSGRLLDFKEKMEIDEEGKILRKWRKWKKEEWELQETYFYDSKGRLIKIEEDRGERIVEYLTKETLYKAYLLMNNKN